MLIDEWMAQPVHTVKPLDSIVHAREIMMQHRINQLPVVLKDQLVGIVTDRDLRDAFPSVFEEIERSARGGAHVARRRPAGSSPDAELITVESVMTSNVLSLAPSDTVERAARLMRRQRIGAVPIVSAGRLVGVVTRSDVLDAFIQIASSEAEVSGA
jgi:acetoin utilization protein AcuB